MTDQRDHGDEDQEPIPGCEYCGGRMRHGICKECGEMPEASLQGTDEISRTTLEERINRLIDRAFDKIEGK